MLQYFDQAERAKLPYEDKARQAYLHYCSHINNMVQKTASQVYEPYLFSAIQTQVTRMTQALFSNEPFLQFLPRGRTTQDQARNLTALFQYHWQERRPRLPVTELLLQMKLFGTAYAVTYWRHEEAMRGFWRNVVRTVPVPVTDEMGMPVVDPMTGMPQMRNQAVQSRVFQTSNVTVCDSPWFDVLHFTEAFPSAHKPDITDYGAYFFARRFRDRAYVTQRQESRDWNPEMCKLLLEKSTARFGENSMGRTNSTSAWQEQRGFATGNTEQLSGNDVFEELEYFDAKCYAVIVNRQFVVCYRDNPFAHGEIPILHLKNYPLPNEHFGLSDFQIVEKLVYHLQEMRNASATEAKMRVHPPLIAKSDTNLKEIKFAPGAIWRVTSDNGIIPLQLPTSGIQVAEQQVMGARTSINDALSTSDAYRGQMEEAATKATAITQAVQGAGIRIQDQIERFEQEFTVRLGDHYRRLIQQYQDYDVQVRVTQSPLSDPVTVAMDDLYDADCDTIGRAGDSQIRALEEKRIIDLYQMAVQAQEPNADRRAMFEAVVERVAPGQKQLLVRPEEVVQQEMMAMQQYMQSPVIDQQGQGFTPPTQENQSALNSADEEYTKELGHAANVN